MVEMVTVHFTNASVYALLMSYYTPYNDDIIVLLIIPFNNHAYASSREHCSFKNEIHDFRNSFFLSKHLNIYIVILENPFYDIRK